MGRIQDQTKYPADATVTGDDYVIGTDADASNATKTYLVSDILAVGGVAASGVTKTFKADFNSGSFSGSLLVYADGILVATLTDTQTIVVALNATIVFIPVGGSAPTVFMTYSDAVPVNLYVGSSPPVYVPIKFSLAHYNNLLDSVTNGYAVIDVTDVA